MNIHEITIENYGAFLYSEFHFQEDGLNFIVGDKGVGKSSVFRAIKWASGFGDNLPKEICNFKAFDTLQEGESTIIKVTVIYDDCFLGTLELVASEEVVKKQGKPIYNRFIQEVYEVGSGGKLINIKRQERIYDAMQRLYNSLVFINESSDIIFSNLVRTIGRKYLIDIDTASNLLELISYKGNAIYREIFGSVNHCFNFNKKTKQFDFFTENGDIYYPSLSEKNSAYMALFVALNDFDNSLDIIIELLFYIDENSFSQFKKYMLNYKKQIFIIGYEPTDSYVSEHQFFSTHYIKKSYNENFSIIEFAERNV